MGRQSWPVHNGGDDADPTIASAIGTHPNLARAEASLFWHLHNHAISQVNICHRQFAALGTCHRQVGPIVRRPQGGQAAREEILVQNKL